MLQTTSLLLKITYVALQGLAENGSCLSHAQSPVLKQGSGPCKADCLTVAVEGVRSTSNSMLLFDTIVAMSSNQQGCPINGPMACFLV